MNKIHAIVLAAGQSSRTGSNHKLLARDATGVAMIARTVSNIMQANIGHCSVVLGARGQEIHDTIAHVVPRPTLPGPTLDFVMNDQAAAGLASSIITGITRAQDFNPPAIMLFLGDMPLITPSIINGLIDLYWRTGSQITVPIHKGQHGHPVIWDKTTFAALLALRGDVGARALLRDRTFSVATLESDDAVVQDFDTPERLLDFAVHGLLRDG